MVYVIFTAQNRSAMNWPPIQRIVTIVISIKTSTEIAQVENDYCCLDNGHQDQMHSDVNGSGLLRTVAGQVPQLT